MNPNSSFQQSLPDGFHVLQRREGNRGVRLAAGWLVASLIFLTGIFRASVCAQTPKYVVTDLGVLAPGNSEANGVNNRGQVSGSTNTATGYHAFIYSNGTMTDIAVNYLPGLNRTTYGYGINNNGLVVAYDPYYNGHATDIRRILYFNGSWYDLEIGGLYGSNNLNDTAGWENYEGAATLQTNFSSSNWIRYGTPGFAQPGSDAYAVNDFRQLVGYQGTTGHAFAAFNFPSTALTDLGTLGGSTSGAYGINSASQITGYSYLATGAYSAFLYSGSTMTNLGALDGSNAFGMAINNSAQITGTYTSSSGIGHAFLYLGPGMIFDVNGIIPPGTTITDITATEVYGNKINDWGQIAATGKLNGLQRAVLLTPRQMGTQFSGGLGDLPNGAVSSKAWAVANGGTVVAGSGSNSNGVDAMTWSLLSGVAGMDFNTAGTGPDSQVRGISADGAFAVGSNGISSRAFRVTTSSHSVSLMLNLSGQNAAAANAVDAVGAYSTGWSGSADKSTQLAVRWNGINVSDELDPLTGGSHMEGTGISSDGRVITGWSDSSGGSQQAFRWSDVDQVTTPLGFLPGGSFSTGMAVSADGTTVVGQAQNASGKAAFRWTQSGGMQDLGDFSGGTYEAAAKSVSSDGGVVVGYGNNVGGQKAFAWDLPHGRRDLQAMLSTEYGVVFPGWTLTSANAISPDATAVAGEGTDPLGNTQAWMAQINSRTYRFVSGESYGGGVFHTSRLGGFGSAADLLGGTAGGGAGSFQTVTIDMQSTSSSASPVGGYCSDIANVSGTAGDTYVVQLSYDPTVTGGVSLGWFNGSQWINAVNGNTGGTPASISGPYDGNPILGHFGVDTTNHVVWAVLNHGGQLTVLKLTSAPLAAVGTATNIGTNLATFNGMVNALGYDTSVTFQYGTDGNTFPISAIAAPATVSGSALAPVATTVIGLNKGVTYYCRIVATNAAGTTVSGVSSFTTLTDPAAVATQPSAVTSNGATLNGTVNALGAATSVYFEYGTDGINFPNSIGATPATVTGSVSTPVSVSLVSLSQSTSYYYRIRATSAGGVGVSNAVSLTLDVLSGFTQVFPAAAPDAQGFLFVNLTPSGILSGWRFIGELQWRSSGVPVGGLSTGDRDIEFRPVPGYIQPPQETVSVTSGDAATVLTRDYYITATSGSGGISVNLKPDSISAGSVATASRAQWRLLGEDDTHWRDSGVTLSGLIAGTYSVECKAVTGRATPPVASVIVQNAQTSAPTITYFLADAQSGTAPAGLTFDTVSTDQTKPYAYVGQIRSNVGSSTGFVVKQRVVATAGHVVFDDGTLSAAQGLQWLFQRDRSTYEPKPQVPRGYYIFDGYTAQRAAENTPGTSSPLSQTLDVAAMYFLEDAGRGGYGGFLASDNTQNEFLLSSANKILVGYPVDSISPTSQGSMFATPPANVTFTSAYGRTYTTPDLHSYGGNSGGPLCVQFQNGSYYPAAVYLGGTGQTVVRAIDSAVIDLFNRAQVSGNGGANNTGGGITQTSVTAFGSVSNPGALAVTITPAAAVSAGGGWRLSPESSYRQSGAQKSGLSAGTYVLQLTTVAGYQAPTPQSVTVAGGQLTSITFTYAAPLSAQQTWRQTYFGVSSSTGNAADTATPAGDGIPNLLKYALNLDPTKPSKLPTNANLNGSNLEYNYTRSTTAVNGGTQFLVEWSDDLSTWSSTGVTQTVLSDNGTVQQVKASMPAGSGSHRFVHLRVQ